MGAGSAFECSQGLSVPKQEANSGAKAAANYSMNGLCNNTNINNNNNSSNNNYNTSASVGSPIMEGVPDQFPAGLRVLVVDDDPTCLKILERMLQTCQYEVTTCSRATVALSLLRERKDGFDLVISDVYMPDMDGFKLLEQVGLEMDLPVIMMSADGETSVVMKGISHGACDYLLKPVRIEALKNIWQHVIRKKRNESKDLEQSGSVEDSDRHRKGSEDVEYASSINEGNNSSWKHSKKRKEAKEEEDEGEQENDDSSTLKKPRVVWSVELHQQFVCAVNQLGIDKAVPKRILELMNVQGLTRENVASHLQKYRLYLRRLSGVGQQQSGLTSSFGGSMEPNFGSVSSLDRSDLQVLAASGQMSRHTLAAIQGGLIGRVSSNNVGIPSVGQGFLLQPDLKGLNSNQIDRSRFGQPFGSSQNLLQGMPTNLDIKQLPKSNQHISSFGNVGLPMDDSPSGIPMMHSQLPAAGVGQLSGLNNGGGLNFDNNSLMVQMMQQQHSLHHQHQLPTSTGMQQQHSLHHRPQQMTSSTGQQQQHHSVHHHQQQIATNPGQLQRSGSQFQNEQLEGVQFQNMASPKLLRPQQILLNDTGGTSNPLPLPTVGNNCAALGNQPVGTSSSGQVNPTPIHGLSLPPARSSPAIGHTTSLDYQNNYLPIVPGNNYSLASTVGLSTQMTSLGGCAESSVPGAGLSDIINSQTLRSSNSGFDTFSGIGQNFGQSTRQGWHVQNSTQNLGLNQSRSVVPNSCYSPSFSASQSSNAPGLQDKGQVRSYVSGEKVMGLSNRFHGDQSVDNELNVKDEGSSPLMVNTKFEGGALPEQFMPDDIMSLLFKQQQEGLGSGEAEFSTDGY